jgi:hypothetical protein
MDTLTNPILVLIFGIVAPLVVALLKRPDWPQWGSRIVALVVALIFGVVSVAVDAATSGDKVTAQLIFAHFAVIATLAEALYGFLLNGSGLNTKLELLGTGTAALTPPNGGGDSAIKPGT